MHNGECQRYPRNDSMYMGAIFMSNRKTKQECLKRQIFALPSSQAGFMKKLKAGMLLFLFDYEERKLYGVFEAMCDGAWNIVPNEFSSSGMSFPAQILVKRIWMCNPLVEDEFRDAIKENYYTSQKFNFCLSYEQVYRLLHLFNSKKINVEQNLKPAYGKSSFDLVTIPRNNSFGFQAGVNNRGDGFGSSNRSSYFSRDIGQNGHQGSVNEHLPVGFDIHPSLTPRLVIKEGMTSSSMFGSTISDGCSKISHQGELSRGFSSPPEDGSVETRESSRLLNIPLKAWCHVPQKCEEENKDLEADHRLHDGFYPQLQSDTDQRRKSVFSRLSDPKPSKDVQAHELDKSLSQLLETISERRNQCSMKEVNLMQGNMYVNNPSMSERRGQWSMKTEVKPMQHNLVNKPSISERRDKMRVQSERRYKMRVQTMQGNLFVNKPLVVISRAEESDLAAALSNCKMFAEEVVELPFINFKRRKAHKLEHAIETKFHVVNGEGGSKFTRRRLVRPFFSEEDHGIDVNVQGCPPKPKSDEIIDSAGQIENVGTAMLVDESQSLRSGETDGSLTLESFGSSVPDGASTWVRVKTMLAQPNVSGVAPEDEPDGSLTLESSRSGVPDGPSTWVCIETMLAQPNASGVVPENEELKASNASEAVSNCEAFIPLVRSGAAAQVFAQHDYSSPASPAKGKKGEIADLLHKRHQVPDAGDDSQGLKACGSDVPDEVPIWVRLKSIAAQIKR